MIILRIKRDFTLNIYVAVLGDLTYTAKPPKELEIKPLMRDKIYTGAALFQQLQTEAENLRKEKKRNVYSGIHKYLYLLEGKTLFPCLLNNSEQVISFPPITNSDVTKMSPSTQTMFVEVTSAISYTICR
jgi:phenylalanyl-tRNA synthetase beta subunit